MIKSAAATTSSTTTGNRAVLEPVGQMVIQRRMEHVNSFQRATRDFESLKYERARLETFFLTPGWPVPFIPPEECARAGFFFLQDGDKVQCAFCRGVAGEWEAGDRPFAEHIRHFPRCPFVCDLPVGNVPIGREDEADIIRQQELAAAGVDVCGPFAPGLRLIGCDASIRGAQPLGGNMNDVATSLAIQVCGNGPTHLNLVTLQQRLKTFENWPAEASGQKPDALAEAGFFYIGRLDHVKCFFCDGGLRNWEIDDDPWFEHARWFPNCSYVRLNRGDKFVDEVAKAKPPTFSGPSSSCEDESPSPSPNNGNNKRSTSGDSDSGLSTASSEDDDQQAGAETLTETTNTEISNSTEVTTAVKPKEDAKVTEEEEIKGTNQDAVEELRKLREATQCKICMDSKVEVVFLPCGHLCSCSRCATALSSCAVCRQPIKAYVKTYLS